MGVSSKSSGSESILQYVVLPPIVYVSFEAEDSIFRTPKYFPEKYPNLKLSNTIPNLANLELLAITILGP